MLPQHLCRIVHAIEFGNYTQRGWTTIGGVILPVMWKLFSHG